MVPRFTAAGRLPAGIHTATWAQIERRFGTTARRRDLLEGLNVALRLLKAAGCRRVYLDGSFVTSKPEPGDFDACWDMQGVDIDRLDPVFLDFSNARARQKRRFLGEFFPADLPEGASGKRFLEFFQVDRESGDAKGIVLIDLKRWRT